LVNGGGCCFLTAAIQLQSLLLKAGVGMAKSLKGASLLGVTFLLGLASVELGLHLAGF
jgi:hypothetical protein